MGIGTLLRYLIGDRRAILALAAHPWAWVIGMVFVVSAGFAREYDGEDLLHDPWYVLLPLAASLGASYLLFCVLYGATLLRRRDGPSFLVAYRAFLSLFWLTAPLAWLYAIPYERMLEPVPATQANLCTLALVSAWRVVLMARVAVVLMGMSPWAAFCRVMAFADGVALLAVWFLPFPIIEIMGGVHLPEAEAMVRNAAGLVGCWGGLSLVVWLLFAFNLETKIRWQAPRGAVVARPIFSWPLLALAIASVAIWFAILPLTQPEQQLRRRVETAFSQGRHSDALALMSAHTPKEFPPHWDPPPRYIKGERMEIVMDIWEAILRSDPAPWVRQRYVQKLRNYLHTRYREEEKVADLLNRLPEGPALLLDMANDPNERWWLERLDPYLRPELRMKNQQVN